MTESPRSTADYVRFHALHRPDAIALIDGRREVDYATFHRDLCRFTRALLELEPPPRGLVAVTCEGDFYVHWLLLLACENLGLPTVSYLRQEGASLPALLRHARLVLCGIDPPQESTARRHVLTKEWVAGAFALSDEVPVAGADYAPLGLNEPHRIRRSSGTTGTPKSMVATRGYEEQRAHANLLALGFTPHSRFLITTPFTVGFMHSLATLCLRLGGTCIGSGPDLARAFVRHRLTHARLIPFQVPSLLDGLPADFRKPTDLTVILGSAPVSDVLFQKLLARLASRIVYQYSTNESGTIGIVGADGLCTLRPGVRLEVVDERGVPVPIGHIGEVRVRMADMVEGYLANPEATARAFRDGWFHPGDAAMLLPSGQLKFVSRDDEMLNIGGLKFAPSAIEDMLAPKLPGEEFAVTSRRNADGIEELCIAVVLKDRARAREEAERIGKCAPKSFGRVQVAVVTAIPRTAETGKVQRAQLKALVEGK